MNIHQYTKRQHKPEWHILITAKMTGHIHNECYQHREKKQIYRRQAFDYAVFQKLHLCHCDSGYKNAVCS